jgi:4-amino-4-deoxy-L-arabinose transferase-like glycosyltransferase
LKEIGASGRDALFWRIHMKSEITEATFKKFAAFTIALIIFWRVIVLFTSNFEIVFDEAQYWVWSGSFDFGYFSKPPLIVWIISASTWACGSAEACVRLAAPFFHLGTALVLGLIAARLWNTKAGLVSALLYFSAPGVSFYSILITTDAPLLLFWVMALYGVVRMHQGGTHAWWLLVGCSIGAGLLAKYAMGYFVVSFGVYLLVCRNGRQMVRGAWFPAGCLVAAVLFLPNILWNLQNNFITVGHTAYVADWHDIVVDIGKSLARTATFVGTQFGLVGPIAGIAFCIVLLKLRRLVKDPNILLLLCFALPPLALIIIQAFLAKAYGGWAAPALVGAILLAAWYLTTFARRAWPLLALALNLVIAAGLYHYEYLLAPATSGWIADPHARMRGWSNLAEEVATSARANKNPVIVVGERKVFSQLSYYLRHQKPTIVKWNPFAERRDSFDISTNIADHPNRPYLMIVSRQSTVFARKFFCRTSRPVPVKSARGTILRVRLQAMWAWRFRGYDLKNQMPC